MRRLEERGLISRGRVGRNSSITLLREDGSGEAYEHPRDRGETWLQLPYEYWTTDLHRPLTLPAKACSWSPSACPTTFNLPAPRGPGWYRISADGTERGLRDLQKEGLLEYSEAWVRNQRSKTGWIEQRQYRLLGALLIGGLRGQECQREATGPPRRAPRRTWHDDQRGTA